MKKLLLLPARFIALSALFAALCLPALAQDAGVSTPVRHGPAFPVGAPVWSIFSLTDGTGIYQCQTAPYCTLTAQWINLSGGAGGFIHGVETGSGSGLQGGGTSGTLSLSLIQSCASGDVLAWSSTAGWACATVTGLGTITGVTTDSASGLQGGGTSGTLSLSLLDTCSNGQFLVWNGLWGCGSNIGGNAATATALASAPDACTTGFAPQGIDVNGNVVGCFAAAIAYPFFAPVGSATSPTYSFAVDPRTGLYNAPENDQQAVIALSIVGGVSGTVTILSPVNQLSWSAGETFVLAALPSTPTDLTSLNGLQLIITGVAQNVPVSTVSFAQTTPIASGTYPSTGVFSGVYGQVYGGALAGHQWQVSRLQSTTSNPAQTGSAQMARRDAWKNRSGPIGMTGADIPSVRGGVQVNPVHNPGGLLRVENPATAGATLISVNFAGTATNWSAVAGDPLLIALLPADSPTGIAGDADFQLYAVATSVTVTANGDTTVSITPALKTNLAGGEVISPYSMKTELGDATGVEIFGPIYIAGLADGCLNIASGNVGSGGCGSGSLNVNGSAVSSPNLNSSSPSPDAGYVALPLKVSGSNVIVEASNVPTATALNATPTLCSTGFAPTGILPNGNATACAALGSGGGGGSSYSGSPNTSTTSQPSQWTNLPFAYDANLGTAAVGADSSILVSPTQATFYGFAAAIGTPTAITLNISAATALVGSGAVGTFLMQYSLNGGTSYTAVPGFPTGGTNTQATYTVTLSTSQDLTQVRVRGGATWDSGGISVNIKLYEIWVAVTEPTGAITSVTAGSQLTGGGTSGNVTLNVDVTQVPLLSTTNTFTLDQTLSGNLNVAGNFNQTGSGSTQWSGKKWPGTSVTVPSPLDYSIGVGSDNLFKCQLVSGASCLPSGSGGGPFTGGTLTSELFTAAPTTGGAGFNLPQGTAPLTPQNGDCWTTTLGLFCQIAGATEGPFVANSVTTDSILNADDTLSGWKPVCVLPGCNPGGANAPTATSQTINNSAHSVDGEAMLLSITSPSGGNSNALWVNRTGSDESATQFQSSFWVYPSAGGAEFEFDNFLFSTSLNIEFMFGTQCKIGHQWQVWNSTSWVDSPLACTLPSSTGTYVQWNEHRVEGDTNGCSGFPCMYYDSVTINGVTTPINMVEPAITLPVGWASEVGFQFQIDVAAASTTVTEYLDLADFVASTSSGGSSITSVMGGGGLTGGGNSGALSLSIPVGGVTEPMAALANKPAAGLVATANLTLSGAQTIDSVLGTAGTTIVLCTAQTTASQNGPWIMQTGAWTRPPWYPTGGTAQAFQFITEFVRLGTVYSGTVWRMTTAGAVTIDTTATAWAVTPLALNASTVTGTLPQAQLITGGRSRTVGWAFGDVATGSVLTSSEVGYVTLPHDWATCTISGWHIMANGGTATVKTARVATGGTALPTLGSNSISTSGVSLASGTLVNSTTVTDFTSTTLSAGDTLGFFLSSVATAKQITFQIDCGQ